MEHDLRSDAYRLRIDPSTYGSFGTTVAMAVAELEGVDETALPTVHDAVDAEAVDAILTSASEFPDASGVVVEFSYGTYRVTARPDELLFRPRASCNTTRVGSCDVEAESGADEPSRSDSTTGVDDTATSTRTE